MTKPCVNCEVVFEGPDEFCPECAAELDAYLTEMSGDRPEQDEYEAELIEMAAESYDATERMAPGEAGPQHWFRKPSRTHINTFLM